MKLIYPIEIFNATVTEAVTGAGVDVQIQPGGGTAISVVATAADSLTDLDGHIEISPDGGTTWYEYADLTQITANGTQLIQSEDPRFTLIRLNVDSINGTSIDLQVFVM